MEVQVNGEWREFPDGGTLAKLLDEVGANQRGVAVALDGEVVRRGSWDETELRPGAKVEILTAVQGG